VTASTAGGGAGPAVGLTSRYADQTLLGGAQSCAAYRARLGLTRGLRSPHRLESVAWHGGRIHLGLVGPGYGAAQVWLKAPDEPGAFCRCPRLGIAFGGRGAAHPRLAGLLRELQRRLQDADLEGLLRVILDDPETRAVDHSWQVDVPPSVEGARTAGAAKPSAAPPPGQAPSGRDRKVPRWGHHWDAAPGELARWGLFCDDDAFEFCTLNEINILFPVVHLVHGEHECLFVGSNQDPRFRWFHATPDLRGAPRPVGAAVRQRLGLPLEPPAGFARLSTDMTEMDVIQGTRAKLERAVAAAGAGDGERIVGFDNTCLPEAMNEDVDGACAPLSRDRRVHLCRHALGYTHERALYVEEETFDGGADRRLLTGLLAPGPTTAAPAAAADRRRFNLVGFPDGPATEELVGLLEACGASFNLLLLPDVDVEAFRRAPRAGTQVFFPGSMMAELHREVLEPLAPAALHPAAPFGLRGTRAWVVTVAQALGCGDAAAARCDEAVTRLQPRWDRLRAVASGLRLGWVVDPRVAERLRRPEAFWGLPALELLTEMGFGLELLAFAPEGEASWAADLASLAVDPARVEVRPFRTPGELDAALRAADLAAVYSDFFFEHRAARRGTCWFSYPDFETGFAGALRTLERLVAVATTPFFRRYAPYLERGVTRP
jgi:hypothetical protein